MAGRLEGRVAVVTGAASGFGLAIAQRFTAEGARVASLDLKPGDPLDGGISLEADVSDEFAVEGAFAAVVEQLGRLDVVVNNAGILGGGWIHEEGATEQLRRQLDVNVAGVWHGCRAALAHMIPQGGGVILNTASSAAIAATPGSPAYGLAKAAVVHLTKSLAAGYGGDGVRVNVVLPGPTPTGIFGPDGMSPELEARYIDMVSVGRIGRPEDIAAAMAYLASDEASFVTGTVLQVDGGFQHRAPGRPK